MTNQLLDAPVHTTNGPVTGIAKGDVAVFRSIPYAYAPRFARPGTPERWEAPRPCDQFGPIAPQSPSALETAMGGEPQVQSEDCLTLSVFSPGLAAAPVMVWIHGGAFMTGAGSTPWYSGVNLAANHGVVVVTINYRLGIFGFFAPDAPGGPGGASDHHQWTDCGNLGIWDQVAALEWVRDNIDHFGGDPANVTIFGESAGGCSVATLCAMEAAQGLFHRAIAQSPSLIQLRSAARAARHASSMLEAANVSLNDLVTMTTAEVLAVQNTYITGGTTAFAPTFDTPELPIDPSLVSPTVALMAGSTSEEWKLFALMDSAMGAMTDEGLEAYVTSIGGTVSMLSALRARHDTFTAAELACAAATHVYFSRPICQWIDVSAATNTTHSYVFDWPSPSMGGMLGACHAMEIPFVFANLEQRGVHLFTGDGADRLPISSAMAAAWTSFAHGNDPWPRHNTSSRITKVFASQDRGAIRDEPDPFSDLRSVW
jgi:para-nitrobenzyl esterase